jgi:hypothetical protein
MAGAPQREEQRGGGTRWRAASQTGPNPDERFQDHRSGAAGGFRRLRPATPPLKWQTAAAARSRPYDNL